MQTHTITLPESYAPLTGHIHTEQIPLPKKVTELTVNNLGSRIITLLGNSRKRTAVIITPGNEWAISDEDIDRMEIAIREPQLHMDTLFGTKWTIALFKATKDRAADTIGVRHTPAMLDAERRLELLFETQWIHIQRNKDIRKRIAKLSQKITTEHKKSVHIWDEITRELLRTDMGRKLFRQLRPLYLERQKKREEAELSEFRSVDVLFRRLLAESQPTNIFIGSPEKGGRFEIYARHISKIAGDVHRKLSKPVQDVSAASIALNLKTYSPISTDFEV